MTMDLDEEMTLYLYVTITTFINKLIQLSNWSLGCSTILCLSFWSSFRVRRRCSKRIFSIRWLHTWINWNVHKKTEGAWIICGTYPLSPVFLLVSGWGLLIEKMSLFLYNNNEMNYQHNIIKYLLFSRRLTFVKFQASSDSSPF